MTLRTAALLSLAALALPARAEEAPPARAPQEILARARAAQGGEAWDRIRTMRFTGTIATGGLSGPLEAGLRPGDRIVSVNGIAPTRLTLHGFRLLLRERPAGTRVELRVRRADGVHRIAVVLRELV